MCNISVDIDFVVYVDDLPVGGKYEEYNKNLGKVLSQFHKVGMHINKGELQLGKEHVLFIAFDFCASSCSLDSYVEV